MIDRRKAVNLRTMIKAAGSRDVYLTKDGRVKTIPAGSTYVGTYSSEISSRELWDDLRYVLKENIRKR